MAPQKIKPFDQVLLDAAKANLSDDRNQRLIFEYYKRAGYLPAKDIQGRTFKSLQDYLSAVQRLVEKERLRNPNAKPTEWLKAAEARLGFNRQIRTAKTGKDLSIVASKQLEDSKQKLTKNRVGAVFPLEIGNNGKVAFDKRKYMSAEGGIPRPVYDFIESKHGTEVANTYQKAVRKEWKDMGVAAKELKAKTGIPFERGHWLANKYGGAESARAGALQIAELNRLQSDAARGDLGSLKETGRASLGWLDDFYEWDLNKNELNVLGSKDLNLADLVAISNKEVDYNAMLSRRETEAKLGTLNPDPVGFNFIGTQIDRDQTIGQKAEIKRTAVNPKANLMPKVARNPLMRGAKAISRTIPGPADAIIPGVVGGGLALAGGATLPQAAEAFGSGVAEGLTGDIDAGPLANNQAYVVNGQQRFINQRNELVDQPGYGLQQRNGNWEVVKRGTGVAAQQERQANQQMMQQASNLIPKVNRAMNPVGARITNEAQYFIINPLQKAFKNVFGNREI
jgi:hypothetical protein